MCYTVHRSKQNQVRQGGYSDLITDNYGAILSSVLFFFFLLYLFYRAVPKIFVIRLSDGLSRLLGYVMGQSYAPSRAGALPWLCAASMSDMKVFKTTAVCVAYCSSCFSFPFFFSFVIIESIHA